MFDVGMEEGRGGLSFSQCSVKGIKGVRRRGRGEETDGWVSVVGGGGVKKTWG